MSEDVAARIQRFTSLPLFPFAGDSFALKPMLPLLEHELIREGEGDRPCHACGDSGRVLWTNGRWNVTSGRSSPLPVLLFVETVAHVDFEHFDEAMAAEFGVIAWRLEAAIRSLDSVGRVHINRWSDGSSHFHVWFQGRPARQLEFYGWGSALWSQLLDPLPTETTEANHTQVLAHFIANMK